LEKRDLIEQLAAALKARASDQWVVEQRADCPSSDVVLRTPCYAAFFVVAESAERLDDCYRRAQAEITAVRGAKEAEWPRDLELVLLVSGEGPPQPAVVRTILDDRFVCRKFVLWANGEGIERLLEELPFWPPGAMLAGPSALIGAGVRESVSGFDPRLLADLASQRPGVEKIVDKLRGGEYEVAPGVSGEPVSRSPSRRESIETRLTGLDISEFRGIRRLSKDEIPLSADIVFIYGPNGVGKTSLADALEWAVTGHVAHVELAAAHSGSRGPDPVVNVFSGSGTACVTCHLSDRLSITRRGCARSSDRLIGDSTARDDRAVIDHVVGTKAPSAEARLPIHRLRDLFRGSHLLSQHDMRRFLEETDPAVRFDILTNMIGAEEFVRFREKTVKVRKRLESHAALATEGRQNIEREMATMVARVRALQSELQELERVLASGKRADNVIAEVVDGARECGCAIDEGVIRLASREPLSRWIEIVATHVEAVVRTRISEVCDLLARLEGVEQAIPRQQVLLKQRQALRADIVRAKESAAKSRGELQACEAHLGELSNRARSLQLRKDEAAQRYEHLAWLQGNLSRYRETQDRVRRLDAFLSDERGQTAGLESDLRIKRQELEEKQAQLRRLEQRISQLDARQRLLQQLRDRLPDVGLRRQELAGLVAREESCVAALAALQQEVESLGTRARVAEERLNHVQRNYDSVASRHGTIGPLLAKLSEQVASAQCPLCGRIFASVEEARACIQKQVSDVPPELKLLARQLGEVRREAEKEGVNARSAAEKLTAADAELQRLRTSRRAAADAVRSFVADVGAFSVSLPEHEPDAWAPLLLRAWQDCDAGSLRLEVLALRPGVDAQTAGIAQRSTALEALCSKVQQGERESVAAAALVAEIESDMVARSLDPHALPGQEQLALQVEEARRAIEDLNGRLAARMSEVHAEEQKSAALRTTIANLDQEIVDKESQHEQYQTIWDRFASDCRAANVAPSRAPEDVAVRKHEVAKHRDRLAEVEKTVQSLRQLARLEELRSEIGNRAGEERILRDALAGAARSALLLTQWVECLGRLESEVSRQQVGVVGTHLALLEPTVRQIYHRLSPHPVFGSVRLLVDEKAHKLDVSAGVAPLLGSGRDLVVPPAEFFSSAQMNVLAITIFLAGALRQRWSGLRTIVIDDPVQQMDEMNVCAFLDLIRGLGAHHQFVILTCSQDFYLLAIDKLSCTNKIRPGSFLAYRMSGVAPADMRVLCDAR
jgi:hypothetical protein